MNAVFVSITVIFSLLIVEPALANARRPAEKGSPEACRNNKKGNSKINQSFEFERELRQELANSKLTKGGKNNKGIIPEELETQCNGANASEMWFELMRGLSYAESGWNHCRPASAKGENSHGLFQMTKGDKVNGKECFENEDDVRDAKKNIKCAVAKMEELMGRGKVPSLKGGASQYWSPFKSKNYAKRGKGGSVVTGTGKFCQMARNIASDGSGSGTEHLRIHWPTENWNPTQGDGLRTTAGFNGTSAFTFNTGAR